MSMKTPPPEVPAWTEQQIKEIQEIFPIGTNIASKGGVASEEHLYQVLAGLKIAAWQMRQTYPHLSYENLRQIIFTTDYKGELAALGQSRGRSIAPTMEPTGQSVAMTNHFPDGCVIVADSLLAQMLLSEDEKYRFTALQTMAHELCHVSDETFKFNLFGETLKRPSSGLGIVFYPSVSALWSEYFAMRYSGLLLLDPKLYTNHLAQVIRSTFKDMQVAFQTYLTDRDHVKVSSYFRQKLQFLCQCLGYAIGGLHGTGMTLDECDPDCAATIAGSPLAEHWEPLLDELNALAASYEGWKDLTALDPLLKRVEEIAISCGFKWTTKEDGALRVDFYYGHYVD